MFFLLRVLVMAVSLTSVATVGSPAPDRRMLLDSNPPLFVPLSLDPSEQNEDSQTRSSSSIDHEINPKPAAYGAQLVDRIAQEKAAAHRLKAEEVNKRTNEGSIEIQRRLVRLKSLYDAVWALHMIEMAHDPKVWRLLHQNTSRLNQPGTDTMSTLQKAKEAIDAGDTRSLEAHIKKVIEENNRLGLVDAREVSELEKFMEQTPTGSVVISRLRELQKVATKNTDESRLLTADIIYGLWWVLERKAKELDRVAKK